MSTSKPYDNPNFVWNPSDPDSRPHKEVARETWQQHQRRAIVHAGGNDDFPLTPEAIEIALDAAAVGHSAFTLQRPCPVRHALVYRLLDESKSGSANSSADIFTREDNFPDVDRLQAYSLVYAMYAICEVIAHAVSMIRPDLAPTVLIAATAHIFQGLDGSGMEESAAVLSAGMRGDLLVQGLKARNDGLSDAADDLMRVTAANSETAITRAPVPVVVLTGAPMVGGTHPIIDFAAAEYMSQLPATHMPARIPPILISPYPVSPNHRGSMYMVCPLVSSVWARQMLDGSNPTGRQIASIKGLFERSRASLVQRFKEAQQ